MLMLYLFSNKVVIIIHTLKLSNMNTILRDRDFVPFSWFVFAI